MKQPYRNVNAIQPEVYYKYVLLLSMFYNNEN